MPRRIEVLKDGASAIYGADAVGGVVNVLLNDEFQGVAVSGRFGFAEKGDIQDQRYSGVAGFGDEHTHIVVGAQYTEQDPILTTQRDFAKTRFDSYTQSFTGISPNFGGLVTVGGRTLRLNTGLANPVSPTALPTNFNSPNQVIGPASIAPVFNTLGQQVFSATQLPTATAYAPGGPSQANLNQFTGLTNDSNRTSAYGSFQRDIFDKYVQVFGDFLYSKTYSQSLLAPQPVTTASSPNPSQNMVIPLGAPYNPFQSQIGQDQALVASANGVAPAGFSTLRVTNRFAGGSRVFREDTNFYRIVAGLRGQVFKDYTYEFGFNHSEDTIDFKNFGLVRSDLVDQALAGGYNADGTAHPATFTTIANPVTGAPVQIVAPGGSAGNYSRVNGVLVPALDAFAFNNPLATEQAILGTVIQQQQSKLTVIDGKFTGFPINLPAGPLGFAIGAEYRLEELRLNTSAQNTVASVPSTDIELSRGIEAGYAEVQIPVVSPTMKIPGVYSLDLDGAGRFENYEGATSNWTPKVSFVYRPIKDVAIRGTYAKSFNEPTLIDTNGPTVSGFSSIFNLAAVPGVAPAGGPEQVNTVTTSNPSLGPIRTDTYDLGIVLSPHQIPGLTLSADLFHVEQKGILGSNSPAPVTTVFNNLNRFGTGPGFNTAFLPFIHVGSLNGPAPVGLAPGQVVGNLSSYFFVTSSINASRLRETGVDFTANYDHDFGKFGAITLGLNGTVNLQFKTNESPGAPLFDNIGLYGAGTLTGIGGQVVPDYKLVPYIEYRYGGASVSALMNYIPSLRDTLVLNDGPLRAGDYTQYGGPNLTKVRDYYDIDMTVSYEFGLNKPKADVAPEPAPKDGKDGGKAVVTSKEEVKKKMALNLLDGLKLTFGVNNIPNARPPFIRSSPDSSTTDVSRYDPYQRYYYFVVSKKF